MSVIVIDRTLRDRLLANPGEAEFRDETGTLIGRFVPSTLALPPLDLTDEEIRQQLSPDRTTYSTAQVLAHVKGAVS